MSVMEFIASLQRQDIHLYLDAGQLRCNAANGVLTQQLLGEIKQRKAELVNFLANTEISELVTQAIEKVSRDQLLPLSYAQQRLWFLNRLEDNHGVYNILGALRIYGQLDQDILRKSMATIIHRHEILRTCFREQNNSPAQVITDQLNDFLTLEKITEENLADIFMQEMQRQFDLCQLPLFSIRLLRLSEQEHVMVINMHHIIFDAWSVNIWMNELHACYSAYKEKRKPALPALTVQYADFSLWQRQCLEGEILEQQLAYWKKQLADIPILLAMPTDKPRPLVKNYQGKTKRMVLSPELSRALRQLSQEQNVSLFMLLLATFQILLSRYSSQDDIAVGSVIANRKRPEIEKLIGFFVNTLVLRNIIDSEQCFSKFLQIVRNTTLAAYDHQDVPFEMIVEHLQPQRSLSHSPLFQVMFTLQNTGSSGLELPGLRCEQVEFKRGFSKFDLSLSLFEGKETLSGVMEYSTQLFEDETIERLIGHYQVMLSAIVNNPACIIRQLPLLSTEEQQQLFVWNQTSTYSSTQCIHWRFEEQVSKTPDNVAVKYNNEQLSYQQLNSKANRLAHYLLSCEVKPDSLLGLCFEPSVDMIIGILAVLKAGAAYVPLDPTSPPARFEYMLQDSALEIIISHRDLAHKLPVNNQHMVFLDDQECREELKQYSTENPVVNLLNSRSLAYVIYTSGSTGQPKGVLIEHEQVDRLFKACKQHFVFNAQDTWTLFHSFAFDFSVWEIWGALIHGGKLLIVPKEISRNPQVFSSLLVDEQVTVLNQTPSAFYQIVHQLKIQHVPLCLRYIVFGGEALDYQQLLPWFQLSDSPSATLKGLNKTQLINMYGITETTVHVSFHPIDKPQSTTSEWGKKNIIGRQLSDLQAYICNRDMALQAIGVPGELYVGGAGLARGYLNRPELTAQRFIVNPFADQTQFTDQSQFIGYTEATNYAQQRLYKTGDELRYLPTGQMEYLGRLDGQVKIRGFRIETGEIETRLASLESIRECVVIQTKSEEKDHDGNTARLVAYIVPAEFIIGEDENSVKQKTEFVKELREQLKIHLPDYMIPAIFILLKNLPLTINGKIDKRALPAPNEGDLQKETYTAPRNSKEKILTVLWQDLLNVRRIGIYDNFFELGGHSLLAARLISLIRHEFKVELPLRTLFEQATIAGLAENLDLLSGKSLLPEIQVQIGRDKFPLSHAQQRLWFMDQLGHGSPQFNIPGAFKLIGKLNRNAFKRALQSIFSRHEILRTVFKEEEGEVHQFVRDGFTLPLLELDWSLLEEKICEREINKISKQHASEIFDLSRDLMLKIKLVKYSGYEHVVLFNIHHIAADGWSMPILTREFCWFYNAYSQDNAYSQGKSDPLPPLQVQYGDFACWQRHYLQNELMEQHLAYWQGQLKDIPAVHSLPLDKMRPVKQCFKAKRHGQFLDEELTQQINLYCQQHNITLFILLQTVFSILLSRYSNETDIVVGTSLAGRIHKDIEPLIGFFINTLVLRADLTGNPVLEEYLEKNRQTILDAYDHQHIPFEMLALNNQSDLSYSPIFQVLFNVQNNEKPSLDFHQLKMQEINTAHLSSKFDLELYVSEQNQQIAINWIYSQALFKHESIIRMANNFMVLLTNCLTMPNQGIQNIPMLAPTEVNKLLVDGYDSYVSREENICAHQLFEKQVKLQPDKIALVIGEEQFTYKDLNSKANRLAHYLIEQGVKPDVLVAVCLERSSHVIISLLAILKAGGAYMPIDANYPAERMAYMLTDSSIDVMITQSRLLNLLPCGQQQIVCVDDKSLIPLLEGFSDKNPQVINPDLHTSHLAYVIYTSGSTGQPKGVLIEHKNLVAYCQLVHDKYAITTSTRLLGLSSVSFDIFLEEVGISIFAGATLVFSAEGLTLSARDFWLQIDKYKITGVSLPTAYWAYLCAELNQQYSKLYKTQMQFCIVGGEELKTSSLGIWQQYMGVGIPLWNTYGPTETTIIASLCNVNDFFPEHGLLPPIGEGLGNSGLYVLSSETELCPMGAIGELYIGGHGLARGYLNQAELSTEKFIKKRFYDRQEQCLYKTGDLVRWRWDGQLEFIGRLDNQVKIRGFRIELSEIERQLSKLQGVKEALLVLWENNITPDDVSASKPSLIEKYLLAYLVLDHMVTDSVAEMSKNQMVDILREQLKTALPEYMIPSYFMILDHFPLTVNGKINHDALPLPTEQDLSKQEYVGPQNPVQKKLCELWQQLLKLEQVGIHDNFFQLGGHSLLATRLVSVIRKAFQIELPLKAIFENATIAQLSAELSQLDDGIVIPAISVMKENQNYPLSYAQQRLWFIDQLQEGSTQYNLPMVFRLTGHLHKISFLQAIKTIVKRHEILRTRFLSIDGQAVQVIDEAYDLSFTEVDLTELADKQQQINRITAIDLDQSFVLHNDGLMRIQLMLLSPIEQVVLINMHHIISDGWSMGIFIHELKTLYTAYINGNNNPLPALALQYGDYAHWQQQWLTGEVLDRQLDYWKKVLAGIRQSHNLPLDKVRPAQQTFNGAQYYQAFDGELTKSCQLLCKKYDVTLFMLLQTAFSVLLCRYSNEMDIVMGTPVAGRNHEDLEPLIGCFVNTLVLRNDLSGNPIFSMLLENSKQQILDAFTHQYVPFEMLVEELKPVRSLSHSPVFQILFSFQNNEQIKLEMPGLNLKPVGRNKHHVKDDLELVVVEDNEQLLFYWKYNTGLFFHETIARMADNFAVLLSAIIEDPTKSIQALPLLTVSEQQKLLQIWNDTVVDYPRGVCVHKLIEQQVKRYPDNIAAVFNEQSLNYSELNHRANMLAHYLLAQGVKPDTLVGLYMERSLEMIVAILAVLKAGCAYVPLDPEYPKIRLEYMLADGGIEIIISQQHLAGSFDFDKCLLICLDNKRDLQQLQTYPSCNPNICSIGLTTHNLAYVIYTSGSTGQPKGVLIEHEALINRLYWMQKKFHFSHDDRILQKTPYSFDVSVWELLLPLMSGARLVFAKPGGHTDPLYLAQTIKHYAVTVLHFVPSMLNAFLNYTSWQNCESVQQVFCSGEALSPDLIKRYFESGGRAELHNLYGPTEACIDVSYCSFQRDCKELLNSPSSLIGKPIDNITLHVLSKYMQLCPIGVPGELHIGGVGLAREYLNKIELTEEKFVGNPFAPLEKLYKTGDLVRWCVDGNLEFIDRIDHQVKIRGFRIELNEIESVLLELNIIKEAVVVARETNDISKCLHAYLVLKSATEKVCRKTAITDIKAALQAVLPDYMVPAIYVILEKLPLTANGKIDRKALPSPHEEDLQKETYVAPSNNMEHKLVQVWRDVLGLEQIGMHDNFFALGGDSILSTLVVSRAKLLHCYFTVRDLFKHQTIADLAAVVENNNRVQAPQYAVQGDMGLLPIQSAFFAMQLPEQHHYNQSVLLQTPIGFTLDQLKPILKALYHRHDALRLRFKQFRQQWQAAYCPYNEMMLKDSIVYHNLEAYSKHEKQQQLEKFCNNEQTTLNISHGPLVKAVYFDYGKQAGRLLLIIHHLLVDGVSWRILLTDMELAYGQLQQQKTITLAAKTSSYQQWAKALYAYAQSAGLLAERDYWLRQLSVNIAPLPGCYTRDSSNTSVSHQSCSFQLSEVISQSLLGHCKKAYRTQINELLLAALLQAYIDWSGQTAMRIMLESHGREELFDDLDISETVGWFTTIYPLLFQVQVTSDTGELIKAVKDQYRSVPGNGIGYGILCDIARDKEINKLGGQTDQASIVFNYLGQFENTINESSNFLPASESTGLSRSQLQKNPGLIGINGMVRAGHLGFTFVFDEQKIATESIHIFSEAFKQALQDLCHYCIAVNDINQEAEVDVVEHMDPEFSEEQEEIFI